MRPPASKAASKAASKQRARIKVQMYLDDEIAIGPGKRELLDLIDEHGSISAAARAMHLSYRRAWLMVDTMNRCFRDPLVTTSKGGTARGGAALTPLGKVVQQRFRTLETSLERSANKDISFLQKLLRPVPRPTRI